MLMLVRDYTILRRTQWERHFPTRASLLLGLLAGGGGT